MNNQVGLVLSGGGAKGVYHVGVMQAITELGMPIHQIAGASIGALNGVVLASAPNITIGTERLIELWQHLPQQEPIQVNSKHLSWVCHQLNKHWVILVFYYRRD